MKLHYQIVGEGPLVVLCHGLVTGNIATWYFSVAQQLAASYRVLMYDMRGHGQSDSSRSGFDLATLAVDLEEIINEFGYPGEPVNLVGHSYGGLVAMHYATRCSQHLNTLTIVDAPMPAAQYIYPSLAGLSEQSRFDDFIAQISREQGITGARKIKKLIARTDNLVNHTTLLRDVGASDEFDAEMLSTITVPTQLIYGRWSPCRDAANKIIESLPQAQLGEIDCGHYIPSEAPQMLADAVDEFLGDHHG